jgi:hypothetical protein
MPDKDRITYGLGRSASIFLAALLLCACEGVGITATDNPDLKLAQADYLINHEGRIFQARRVTQQAIDIFTQRNDKAGLARAYRQYAIVAEAGGLGSDPVVSRDPHAPMAPRPEDLDLTEKYLKMALDLTIETKQLHLAANITFIQGNVQVLRGTPLKSCSYYDLALQRFREADQQQPGVKLEGPPPAEFLARAKKEAGCP